MKLIGAFGLLALAGGTLADLAAVQAAVAQWTNDVNVSLQAPFSSNLRLRGPI
jgi:hypothetical protein